MIEVAERGLIHKPAVRQFVKFCIIGFTSMIIDVAIAKFLTYRMSWHWILAQTVSFSFAVTNGFIWNSLWTFRGLGSGARHEQYLKFVLVNIAGLCLNVAIMKTIFFFFTGRIIGQGNPDEMHWNIAKGAAILVVAMWNFFANKHWTFKPVEE
jgi:putative flippase GtrA